MTLRIQNYAVIGDTHTVALVGNDGSIIRVVEGPEGSVTMHTSFMPRFDYGQTRPWIRGDDQVLRAGAGPGALELRSEVRLQTFPHHHAADFTGGTAS